MKDIKLTPEEMLTVLLNPKIMVAEALFDQWADAEMGVKK